MPSTDTSTVAINDAEFWFLSTIDFGVKTLQKVTLINFCQKIAYEWGSISMHQVRRNLEVLNKKMCPIDMKYFFYARCTAA